MAHHIGSLEFDGGEVAIFLNPFLFRPPGHFGTKPGLKSSGRRDNRAELRVPFDNRRLPRPDVPGGEERRRGCSGQ